MKELLTAFTLLMAALGSAAALAGTAALPVAAQEGEPTPNQGVITPGRFVVDALSTSPQQAPGQQAQEQQAPEQQAPGQQDAPPAFRSLTSAQSGSHLRFCFAAGVPQEVQAAALRAGAAWDAALDLQGPVIEVSLSWSPFASSRSLGLAGPGSFVEHPDLPMPTHRYPVALANELLNTDFAPGVTPCDPTNPAEVVLRLNSTAEGETDLTTLIIHEIAHGLGFTGSAELGGNGELRWPADDGTPYVYDLFASRCALVVIDACGPGQTVAVASGDLGSLTGEALWFRAGTANLELHAPSRWDVGSSFSHLDDDRYPMDSGVSLMTPFLARGERHTRVDAATAAVLQQLGWRINALPTTSDRIGLTPLDGGIQISFGQPPFDEAPTPVEHLVRIQRLEIKPGETTTVTEPFAPVTIADQVFAITGLTNGSTYRLLVQGTSPAGVGPVHTTAPFVVGADGATIAAQQLATQVLLDLRNDLASGDETLRLTNDVLTIGPGPAVAAKIETQEFDAHASIVRLYLGFLGRVPDSVGIEFWISQHRQGRNGAGQDLTTVATRFAEASQFELGTRLTDQQFVARVYDTILGRQPEQAGLDYWVGRLEEGMPRGRLLLEVSESVEHRISSGPASQVIATYIGLLDRLPTQQELADGEALVANGRIEQFAGQLVTGPEYQNRIAR